MWGGVGVGSRFVFHFTPVFLFFTYPINPSLHFTLLFTSTTRFPSLHFPSLFLLIAFTLSFLSPSLPPLFYTFLTLVLKIWVLPQETKHQLWYLSIGRNFIPPSYFRQRSCQFGRCLNVKNNWREYQTDIVWGTRLKAIRFCTDNMLPLSACKSLLYYYFRINCTF